jgi:hypothetical protein
MEVAMSITIPKRHPKRVRVMLESMIETAGKQQKVRVCDISREGMLIQNNGPLVAGDVLKLSVGSQLLEGKVAWQEGTWSGVAFNRTLNANVWDAICRQPLMVTMPRRHRQDRIGNDQSEPIEVTPRVIRFAQNRAMT